MKKLSQILTYIGIYFVSLVLIFFAISKMLNGQFQNWNYAEYMPLKDLSNMRLAWAFFGRSYNYNLFLGIIEFLAAIAMVFKKTRLLGLLLAAGVYINIIIIDLEFDVKNAIFHATIEFIIVLLLLAPYLKDLKKFFWEMGGRFDQNRENQHKFWNLYLPITFVVVCSFVAFQFITTTLSSMDKIIGAYKISGFSVQGQQITVGQGKFTKSPMLFFEFGNNCILSVNDSSYFGTYTTNVDSIFLNFRQEVNGITSLKARLSNNNKTIMGMTDKSQVCEITVEKIYK